MGLSEDDKLRRAFVEAVRRDYSMVDRRDLYHLVKAALQHEEITGSKAAELLGLSLEDVRVLWSEWTK